MAIRTISLFTGGAAGLDLGLRIALGSEVKSVCYVENECKAVELLLTRIQEGSIDDAPVWSDVRTFNGSQWRGRVDLICGGFPCTDLSVAGDRKGITAETASGLWFEFARIIREVRPEWVFVENVSGILVPHADDEEPQWVLPAGLWFVLGALSELGFDAEWITFRASDVGASQERNRTFILAHQRSGMFERRRNPGELVREAESPEGEGLQRQWRGRAFSGSNESLGDGERSERRQSDVQRGRRGQGRDGSRQEASRPGVANEALVDTAGARHGTGVCIEGGPLRDRARWPEPDGRSSELGHSDSQREDIQSEISGPRDSVGQRSSELERASLGGCGELRESSEVGGGQPDGAGSELGDAARQLGTDGGSGRRGVCQVDQKVVFSDRRGQQEPGRPEEHGTQNGGTDVEVGYAAPQSNGRLGIPASAGLQERGSEPDDFSKELAPAIRSDGRLFPPGQGTWTRWFTSVDGRAFRAAKDADAQSWCETLRDAPWMLPAVEPGFRCDVHGISMVVDQERTDQLRALGLAVVPLQAAVAFTELMRRILGA